MISLLFLLLPIPTPPVYTAPAPSEVQLAQGDAGQVTERILNRIRTFRFFRSKISGANWGLDESRRFVIRSDEECLASLNEKNVPYERVVIPSGFVPTPVQLTGPIDGVYFNKFENTPHPTISCELADYLSRVVVPVFKSLGVIRVGVGSSYRTRPRESFHTMGMGLDVYRFEVQDSENFPEPTELVVRFNFQATPNQYPCDAQPRSPKAKKLLQIACALHPYFQSVLTPNYNRGHRDHFHLDIRPYDPRLFLR